MFNFKMLGLVEQTFQFRKKRIVNHAAFKPQERSYARGAPVTYRIDVQGCLNESLSERLSGMCIIPRSKEDQAPVTTLVGRVRKKPHR